MTYAAWLLSTEARGYETKNQRHSSRALPAQHDASLASPRELGAIPLQALAIDFCTSGGKTDPLCSSPRCMGQGAPMPNCSHFVTGSCQLTPNATRSSRVSREPRVWGMVVGRGCPRGAGELGAPSECAAAAAPAGLARLVLGAGPRPGRAWLRAQGRDVLPGQSTAQAGTVRSPQQGGSCSHLAHAAGPGGRLGSGRCWSVQGMLTQGGTGAGQPRCHRQEGVPPLQIGPGGAERWRGRYKSSASARLSTQLLWSPSPLGTG